MANFFWVHGTGTWDNANTTNWSTSSGGLGGSGPPTATDNVFFDGNSPLAGVCNCTLAATAACNNATFTSVPNGDFAKTLTHPTSTVWTISGSLTLSAGMTYTLGNTSSSSITFNSTSNGNTITANGHPCGNTTFNGVGGGWQHQDAYQAGATNGGGSITITNGAWDSGGHNMSGGFLSNNTNTRSITLGATTYTLWSTGTIWQINATGLTFSGASSTILFTNTSSSTKTFSGGGLAYGTLHKNSAPSDGAFTIAGNNSFTNLILDSDSNVKFNAGNTQIVSPGGFSAVGTSGHPITIVSSSPGSNTTILSISTGVTSCDYLVMQDIHAATGGGYFAGANSTNNGNNTGWNFRIPDTFNNIMMAS